LDQDYKIEHISRNVTKFRGDRPTVAKLEKIIAKTAVKHKAFRTKKQQTSVRLTRRESNNKPNK